MSQRYNPQDHFFKQAKIDGYRARSVYKLIELNDKFEFLKTGQIILDLGCAPGSWLQFLAEQKPKKLIGLDLKLVDPVPLAKTFVADIFNDDLSKICQQENIQVFDLITSDIAPNTTGVFDIDQYASVELNLKVLTVTKKYLKPHGWAVFKIFRGEDFNDFWLEAKKVFPNIKTFKPEACRDRSFEVYCVGKKK